MRSKIGMDPQARERRHLAQVTPYYFPSNGGIASFVTGLSNGLERAGYSCSVVCEEGGAAPHVRVVGGPKLIKTLKTFAHLFSLRPDIVHVHGHWYLMIGALAYSRLFRKPALLTTHLDRIPATPMRRRLLGWLMNRFDQVVSVAQYIQELDERNFKLRRPMLSVIYASIDIPAEHITPKEHATRLVAVSNFAFEAKTQGVAMLVRSMKLIAEQYPDAQLDIIGDGHYRGLVEEAVRETEGYGTVRLLGSMGPERVRSCLLEADAFVHVSLQDVLPMVIFEAMSVGLPMVVYPVGGIPEVLKNGVNSVYVEPDCGSIAAGIKRVLGDPALRLQLHKRCLADVQRFSWEASVVAYDDVYRCAEASRPRQRRIKGYLES